jgi:tetratricopeptide (TPR) repeat protein
MSRRAFHAIAVATIVAVGALLYGPTLPFPFEFDDEPYLINNPYVKDIRSFDYFADLPAFARSHEKAWLPRDLTTNFILRPLTYFTFYLNYITGDMDVRGYRAVNIGIHCANALLVLAILLHMLRRSRKCASLPPHSAEFIALTAALLFLAHPLQIESVTYVVQRFTSLATLFYLLTILTGLLANAAENGRASAWLRGCSVGLLILGMLSKEIVFTAPLLLVLLDWIVMGAALKLACKRAIPHLLCLPILPALIVWTSWAQNQGNTNLSQVLAIATEGEYSPRDYAITQLCVVVSYLRLIIIPSGLNLDPDYPLFTSLLRPRVFASLLLIVAMITAAWLWFRRRTADVRRSLLFCSVLWYFLTLAVDSSIVPLPDLMAEHRCYLASVGALSALVCLLDLGRTQWLGSQSLRCATLIAAVWIACLSVATTLRNELWRSSLALWLDTTRKSPNKARPWGNLGAACGRAKQLEESAACFRKCIVLQKDYVLGYINLGTVDNMLGRYAETLEISKTGLRYVPRCYPLHFNMGAAYHALGRREDSIRAFNNVLAIHPGYALAHDALGKIYTLTNQYDKALEHCRTAASLQPLPHLDALIARLEFLLRYSANRPAVMTGP